MSRALAPRSRRLRAGALLFLSFTGAPSGLPAHTPATTRYSFSREVRPIVERRCGECHRPGGIGPMSLLTYAEARPWAAAIRGAVLSGRMPPWPAEDGVAFAGERLLTAREIDILADWTAGGAPQGEPAAPSVAPAAGGSGARGAGWALGGPDVVLEMPAPYTLGAAVDEARAEAVFEPALEGDRWLRAWELQPGNPAVVHDARIALATEPPEALGSWTPGQAAVAYPEGTGRLLPRGAGVRLSLHYRRGFQHRGKELSDRSRLGLWLHAGAPRLRVRNERLPPEPLLLHGDRLLLAIAPGAKDGERGGGPLAILVRPPGVDEPRLLLSGRAPGSDWPMALRLVEPLRLPRGARIETRPGGPGAGADLEVWMEFASE